MQTLFSFFYKNREKKITRHVIIDAEACFCAFIKEKGFWA